MILKSAAGALPSNPGRPTHRRPATWVAGITGTGRALCPGRKSRHRVRAIRRGSDATRSVCLPPLKPIKLSSDLHHVLVWTWTSSAVPLALTTAPRAGRDFGAFMSKTILVIGTYDTKDAELLYVCDRIRMMGGRVVSMDVSVLGDPSLPTDISKHEVAGAGGSSIAGAIALGDENQAMQVMARGAAALTAQLYCDGKIDGMLALGGSMGTDLALDCARALPIGVPKYVVSTISFSALIPPDRLSADIQMILWAGGLYGLNELCKSSLSQAAGAVLGAAMAVEPPRPDRPVIAMTGFSSSVLKCMVYLRQPLLDRGFSVAVFHATGMGGMAMESLAAQGYFACVLDFAVAEVGNLMVGSIINAGENRMMSAGLAGIPQIVAPGFADLVDFAAWAPVAERLRGRPYHAHNRLIASAALTGDERRDLIRDIARRLRSAKAPVHFVLPLQGIEEWDRDGSPLRDEAAMAALNDEVRQVMTDPIQLSVIDVHINDLGFSEKVLEVLDGWIADGTIKMTR